MYTNAAMVAAVQAGEGSLTLDKILDNLPTDPASIFTLILFAIAVAMVVWFGRPRGGKGGRGVT